jgi:peroxiredoxin
MLKGVIRISVVVCLLAVLNACSISGGTSSLVGKPAPFTHFIMLDGSTLTLEELRGKNVVVAFWATSCTFSGAMMDRLNDYIQTHKQEKNLEVIAVSVDKSENFPKVKERLDAGGMNAMRHSFSGNDVQDEAYMAFDVGSLPSFYVINPQGVVTASGGSEDTVIDALDKIKPRGRG